MILLLASKFESNFTPSIEYLQSLPEIVHKYGDPKPEFLGSRWVSYASTPPNSYRLSFLGSVVESMPEFAVDVLGYLSRLLGESMDPNGLALMRTIGYIPPHSDETRLCAINIGLYNTDSAVTRCHRGTDTAITEQVCCVDSAVYLLDTATTHSVYSETFTPRFLVSYALYEPFDTIVTKWRHTQREHYDN